MKNYMRLFTVLCVMQMSSLAMAVNQTWTNAGGDQDWFNNSNWNDGLGGGATPGAADEAHLNITGILSANVGATGSVGRLVLIDDVTLDIQAGGDLDDQGEALIGIGLGLPSSEVIVDGTLSVATLFAVGHTGDGTLTVGAAGTVNANDPVFNGIGLHIGNVAGTTGTVVVNGGAINSVKDIALGHVGVGSLTVNNGGSVSTGTRYLIGNGGFTGDGTLVVNDGTVSATTDVIVGVAGIGKVTVNSAGSVNAGRFLVGNTLGGGGGTVNIDGGTVTTTADYISGLGGTGSLTIGNSGTANVGRLISGNSAGSSDTIVINDGTLNGLGYGPVGSETLGDLIGGLSGTSSVTVNSGGNLNTDRVLLGNNASGNGSVVVNSGGTVTTASHFFAGLAGTGSLTINGGGTVNVGGILLLGNDLGGGATGTVTINDGTLTTAGFDLSQGTTSSVLVEDAGLLINNGGLGHTPGSGNTVTINDGGEIIHNDTAAVLAGTILEDVRGLIFGNPDWIFSDAPKITQNLDGSVSITNVDGSELAGDFDFDGDVDGADFIEWQHGHSLNPFSAGDLLSWKTNYGMIAPLVAGVSAAASVPEPSTALLFGSFCLLCSLSSRKKSASFFG